MSFRFAGCPIRAYYTPSILESSSTDVWDGSLTSVREDVIPLEIIKTYFRMSAPSARVMSLSSNSFLYTFIHLLIHSLIQQMFIECLFCARGVLASGVTELNTRDIMSSRTRLLAVALGKPHT